MRGWIEEDRVAAAIRARRARRRGLSLCALAVGAAMLLASCASVPIPQRTPSEWMGVLPGDATMYISLSVPRSAALIKKSLVSAGLKDVTALIDPTSRLVASVTLAPQTPPQFAAVALGSYPKFWIGVQLSGSKDWKRQSNSFGEYWQWKKAGIQLGVPSDSLILAANGGLPQLQERYGNPIPLRLPVEVADDMRKADLVLYMRELPGGLSRTGKAAPAEAPSAAESAVVDAEAAPAQPGLPVQDVWMEAVKAKGSYVLSATANTGSEKEAKLVALVFKLGLVSWLRSQNLPNPAGRLKAVTVAPDGTQVRLSGLAFTEDELVTLFGDLLKSLATPKDATDGAPVKQAAEGGAPEEAASR